MPVYRGSKKKGSGMGSHMPTKEETEAIRWCINNGIHISPWARDQSTWYVSIIINRGKNNVSSEFYERIEIWKKIHEYYKYYYDKHKI
jgi:hypothetical protein